MKKRHLQLIAFLLLSLSLTANSTEHPGDSVKKELPVILKIDLKKEVGGSTWLYIQKGFEKAKEENAAAILIHMNTYGGEVVYADSIRSKIIRSKIPVSVFIDNNAASAGALISIACKNIYMYDAATIGATTVVNQTGEKMPDKYQSYMRATMRSTAEHHGKDTIINGNDTTYRWKRDPTIAEAMVDERIYIPGIIDSTKVLTFSTQEAIEHGYCEGSAKNVKEVIELMGYPDYELITYNPSTLDNIKGFFMSSVIQGILIMIIIGGIYFELQSPGIGFPIFAAITAAILYFVPLYIDGLAENWEILLFLVGLILLALEIFVIPGFGIAGISGIGLIMISLTLSLLNNVVFNFENVKFGEFGLALLTVSSGILLGFVLTFYLSSKIGSKGLLRNVALTTSLEKSEGYMGVSMEETKLLGMTGTATTVLRPSGKVEVAGRVYDAVSEQDFISRGEKVVVIRYETGQIYVERA